MHPSRSRRRPVPAAAPRRLHAFLAGLVACWLLAQLLGQAHAVLHPRRAASVAAGPAAAPAPAGRPAAGSASGMRAGPEAKAPAGAVARDTPARWLARAFHPRGDGGGTDDGVCRLYGQLAHGDLAADARPAVATAGLRARAAPAQVAAAASTAPRRGTQARGPPARA